MLTRFAEGWFWREPLERRQSPRRLSIGNRCGSRYGSGRTALGDEAAACERPALGAFPKVSWRDCLRSVRSRPHQDVRRARPNGPVSTGAAIRASRLFGTGVDQSASSGCIIATPNSRPADYLFRTATPSKGHS